MSAYNIFDEDWRECLRAHYFHVVQAQDANNEASLRTVLVQTGFTEEDIAAMRDEVLAELGQMPGEQPDVTTAAAAAEAIEPVEAELTDDQVPEQPLVTAAVPAPTAQEESLAPPDEPGEEVNEENDEPPAPLVQMSLF